MSKVNRDHLGVLIAEDAAVLRSAIKFSLQNEPAIRILGEATSLEQTISLAATLKPDVILLDLHMKDIAVYESGFVRGQLAAGGARVLAISLLDDDHEGSRKLADTFGAEALLNKADLYKTLIPAILNRTGA
jgi:DNA-binding NarL/FixJ family response regulator